MPVAMHHDGGNVYRIEIGGTLRKLELDRCMDALKPEIERLGSVKVLFVLDQFEGWDSKDDWGDLTFYVAHGDAIERIAIVGDPRWRSEAMMFASADLRKGPVEFFAADALDAARAWLTA
jgi:hypothetical protein